MSATQQVRCPFCNHLFEIAVPPPEDFIICPKCKCSCDWWADGDIGPDPVYYLTRPSPFRKTGGERLIGFIVRDDKAVPIFEK